MYLIYSRAIILYQTRISKKNILKHGSPKSDSPNPILLLASDRSASNYTNGILLEFIMKLARKGSFSLVWLIVFLTRLIHE